MIRRLTLTLATMLLWNTYAVLANDQVLRIATEGAFAPYNFTRSDGGLDGFEVDLANTLCGRMKVKCELVAQEWDGIIPGLQLGKYDAILAAVSITPKRQEVVSFSKPYLQLLLGFGVLSGSPLNELKGTGETLDIGTQPERFDQLLADWKPALQNKVIGVQTSTVGVAFMAKHLRDVVTVREYKSTEQHDLDLRAGRLDAVFAAYPTLIASQAKSNLTELRVAGTGLRGGIFGEGIAVALRKDDLPRKVAFDKAIDELIADGTMRNLSMKWFKFDLTPGHQ